MLDVRDQMGASVAAGFRGYFGLRMRRILGKMATFDDFLTTFDDF